MSDVRKDVEVAGAEAMVLTALDEVAWIMNLRGSDIPYNPGERTLNDLSLAFT